MTPGQARAVRELNRLQAADPDGFQIVETPCVVKGLLRALISLRLGPMEAREGGLDLREREEFVLTVPSDFPFDQPILKVRHLRFAGFPHVIWSKKLCLYQAALEWNPSDGLFGFFDRLRAWLRKAAINDMDPIEGPLEPPHHVTDFSQVPFIVRCNAPVKPGEMWFGLAELEKQPNRIELVGWNDLQAGGPIAKALALAVMLPEPIPMEFPKRGGDFFAELLKQGLDREKILRHLALAALLTPAEEPIHLVLGLPMRRASDGTTRLHIAVWTTDSSFAGLFRSVLPKDSDSETLRDLRKDLADRLYLILETATICWCRVLDDRAEIVVRRYRGTPMASVTGKRVLVLGCGATGSWAAEIVARSGPQIIHVVDNSIVKPGLLARQNYQLDDVGSSKAEALARRLRAVVHGITVEFFDQEAHRFLTRDVPRLATYDLVLDCTASAIFQMKLERDWDTLDLATPPIISMILDAEARRCVTVVLPARAPTGIWDAYVQFKRGLCLAGDRPDIAAAFYSEQAMSTMFQPEPGCSDPTFVGSTADVASLTSTALNLAMTSTTNQHTPLGFAFAALREESRCEACAKISASQPLYARTGLYRIRISNNVFCGARAWVRHNRRTRTPQHETGGLLWGLWDDAIGVIWVWDVSGPPPDSLHDPGHFVCGVQGTAEEHLHRHERSRGTSGFIGFWHTHPDMPSEQSVTDIVGMSTLVSQIGLNQKRAMMMIFGRTRTQASAGIYVYESQSVERASELVSVGMTQIPLEVAVV